MMIISTEEEKGAICNLISKAKTASVLISAAMLVHALLHTVSPLILAHFTGTWQTLFSMLLTVLRLGIPSVLIIYGSRRFSLPMYDGGMDCSNSELFAVFVAAFTGIYLFGLAYSLVFPSVPLRELYCGSALQRILSAVLITVMPAALEELLMRRLVMGRLAVYNQSASLIISSLIFALMHFSPEKFPYAFVCGLIIGAAYLKAGSLAVVVAVHFANNFTAYVSGFVSCTFSGKVYTAVSVCFTALCVILAAFSVPKILRMMKRDTRDSVSETGAAELITPALVVYMAAAIVRQFFFM